MMNMKNTAKKATELIKAAAIMWGGWFCMTKSTAASEAVSSASERCLTAVIPSLYAMMIVSGLMIRTGLIQGAARYTSRAGRLIFGMEGEVSAVFLFSMFAGYPVGARMIGQLYDSGRLSKRGIVLRSMLRGRSGICTGLHSAAALRLSSGRADDSNINCRRKYRPRSRTFPLCTQRCFG